MGEDTLEAASRILDYASPRKERTPIFTTHRTLMAVVAVFILALVLSVILDDSGIAALSMWLSGVFYISVRSAQETRVAVIWRILTALAGIFYLCAACLCWIDFWREPWTTQQNWGWYWQDVDFRNGVWILLSAISMCVIVRCMAYFTRAKNIPHKANEHLPVIMLP
ncbi:MAG: hypothetical protein M3O30_06205 [Planctomycetota bacterium]|nr:hypothetical protein [Planctomycetota bacterium]